jgi:hypothetical protein
MPLRGARKANVWGDSLAVSALSLPPLGRPFDKPLHLRAVLPSEMKEFAGVHARRFWPEEGLKSPAKIGASPGIQAVALCGTPVKPQDVEHSGVSRDAARVLVQLYS